ncbi:MAG: efflux RND transporter periplasmic adaptor subunit [Saprospiraceae bacterium]
MQNILKISLIISISFLAFACGKKEAPVSEAPPAAATLVNLSAEQMKMAGIELGKPEKRVISGYIECTGRIEVPPYSLYSVFAPSAGFVQSVKHLPGDYVKKGTLLTQISHPDLVKLQREFLEVQSQLEFLKNDMTRKETLAAAEAASQKAFEQAKADYQLQLARYKGLKAELDLMGIATQQLESKGTIQNAITLSAPINGFITKVNINNGKLISPTDLLYEIVNNQHMHLELQVFAKDVAQLREGQRIECQMPGSERIYTADVHVVGKMIDPETKTTMVHGHFKNEPIDLIPGTYVQARIHTDAREVLAVPTSAIITEGNEHYIFVKKVNGFKKVPVITGKSDGNYMEIEPLNLESNEQLALKGAYYINGSISEEE